MKHDIAHEVTQDEQIRRLATCVAALAARLGENGIVAEAHAIQKEMVADEAAPAPEEPPAPPAPDPPAPPTGEGG